MTAIAVSDLVYVYPERGFTFLCRSLALPSSEITVITGPNGSGKTTLSKLLCGLLKPQQGEVRLFGKRTSEQSLGEIGRRVGYLFQNPSQQLFTATVWREMTYTAPLLGQEQAAVQQKAKCLLQRFGLLPLCNRGIHRLSWGEKQRLALCTILMNEVDFLVLDEPTVGLDQENRGKLYSLLNELLAKGKGLAVISHDQELLAEYPNNRILVENGEVLT
ncbi:MAG TPA: ABC transporter ATP-binding protein [Firmicutes bacterium]|nr:ABC transporter ATP-binding protein [Bacillota bacterium]